MQLDARFEAARDTASDINEHVETLYALARACRSVRELGVRSCVSSWALLRGLRDGSSGRATMLSVDLERCPEVDAVASAAATAGVAYAFVRADDLDPAVPELDAPADLTFIDTWHVYGQLRRELDRYAPTTRRYIAMHDTEIDGERGETARTGYDPRTGDADDMPDAEVFLGLRPAIDEFLRRNPEWRLALHRPQNNGLTVLERSDGLGARPRTP